MNATKYIINLITFRNTVEPRNPESSEIRISFWIGLLPSKFEFSKFLFEFKGKIIINVRTMVSH